ncbi:MAG: type II secretion system F family protein [Puniceicoccales bacterium]|jgi:type II secretory pathway component PulF|nr:type II secretion system F family protein [Puniceicoccales bacterium]
MKFKYRGLDAGKRVVRGEIEADSRRQAMRALTGSDVVILGLSEASAKGPLRLGFRKHGNFVKFSDAEMGHFLEKLAHLYRGGLMLSDALESMAKNTSQGKERSLSFRILENLRDGDGFAQSLKKCCNFFDNSMLSILELGELAGKFLQSLDNVIALLRRKIETKKRLIAGLSYPLFICCVAFLVILLFLFYLMPRMDGMLRNFGGQLPVTARILISCSRFLANYFPVFLLLAAMAGVFCRYLYRFAKYRLIFDRFFLKIPALGYLYTLSMRVRIASMLASLLSGGVAASEAIDMVSNSISNSYFKKNYTKARDAILDGTTLASAFKTCEIFDGSATDIIAVGEKTGDVASHFASLAATYDVQLNDFLKKSITITSSAALLLAFVIVAILALSIVSTVLNFSAKLVR